MYVDYGCHYCYTWTWMCRSIIPVLTRVDASYFTTSILTTRSKFWSQLLLKFKGVIDTNDHFQSTKYGTLHLNNKLNNALGVKHYSKTGRSGLFKWMIIACTS